MTEILLNWTLSLNSINQYIVCGNQESYLNVDILFVFL